MERESEMWRRVEGGARPAGVDDTSSREYVYVRRNAAYVGPEGEGEDARPGHWEWDELAVPRGAWEAWEQADVNADAIADLAQPVADSADMVEVLSQAVEELASIIGGE